MSKIKVVIAALAFATAFGTAHAERDFAAIYKECGLGAMLFPEDSTLAVITNVTWDLGTTAVTSGLSSPGTCQGDASVMAAFIMDSHPQIEQDLAYGEGAYLTSMMTLMGCNQDSSAALQLRESFSKSIENGYYEASDVKKSEMLFNSAMSASCSI